MLACNIKVAAKFLSQNTTATGFNESKRKFTKPAQYLHIVHSRETENEEK